MKAKFINEILDIEQKRKAILGYNKYQWFIIKQWGSLLYMDYDIFKSGPGNYNMLSYIIDDYLQFYNDQNEEELEEYDEWTQAGLNGQLTKDLIDEILISAQTTINKPLTIYKYGVNDKSNRWISTTSVIENTYSNLGPMQEYNLPIGTKIIYADGIADSNEIIIHSSELP